MGAALGTPCVTNVWIPDGYKDTPVDRAAPRQRLRDSLDQIFATELEPAHNLDAVESKFLMVFLDFPNAQELKDKVVDAALNGTTLAFESGGDRAVESSPGGHP